MATGGKLTYFFACCIYGICVCEIEILAPRNVENGILVLHASLLAVVAEI